jgi:hypothetical protein
VADPKDASKKVEKLHLGDYHFITSNEMAARVVRTRSAPRALAPRTLAQRH